MTNPWQYCGRCKLAKTRRNIVFLSGEWYPDILFIGEAPGVLEDIRGIPFVGTSGRLLGQALTKALELIGADARKLHTAKTNVCACRPCDDQTGPNRQPTKVEALQCRSRLLWEIERNHPKRLVVLGLVAKRYLPKALVDGIEMDYLQHPAYILRCGGLSSPAGVKFVRDLSAILQRAFDAKSSLSLSQAGKA